MASNRPSLNRRKSAGGRAMAVGSSSRSSILGSLEIPSRGRFGMVVEIPKWFFTAFLSVFGLGMGGMIAVIGFFARRLVALIVVHVERILVEEIHLGGSLFWWLAST